MEFNQNRLRFVHCEHLFNDINEIKHYVRSVQNLRAALYAEPMIFKYGDEKKPCIVLAIGSVGNGKFEFDPEEGTVLNETFYIDFSQVERDIIELYKKVGENKAEIERIDGIVKNILVSSGFNEKGEYVPDAEDLILKNAKSLKEADSLLSSYILALEKRQELYVKETSTIKPTLEKGETGTTLSGNVKLGTKIFDGRVIDNIIIEQEDGIFTNVDLDYVEDESKLVFTINGENKKDVKLPKEYHLINGEYDVETESLKLKMNDKLEVNGELTDTISINLTKLIDEWTVLGEDSETPIILTKEHIGKKELSIHDGNYDWQDVLKADVRIIDNKTIEDNILAKTEDGKYLYVDGKASKISYMNGNKKITVQEGIDKKIDKTDISQNPESTIVYRTDGLYSMIDFDYDSKTNKIIFKRTNPKGEVVTVEKELNSLQLIKKAYYDNTSEEIVIVYVDAKGEVQELRIPLQIVIDAFDVDNTDTTVTLTLNDVKPGVNTLKADVNISKQDKNILEDVGHALYVRGTADNIEMVDKTLGKTVEESFTTLNSKLETSVEAEKNRAEGAENKLREDLTLEINRAKKAEEDLNDKIEKSSRDDKDERDRIERKLDSEIDRSIKRDDELDKTIKAESERADKVESTLRKELDAEVIRSKEEDAKLDSDIKEESRKAREEERIIRDSVEKEKNNRELADADIQGQLTREIERSTNKDKVLEEQLGLEINRATEKENAIESNLNKEIQERKDADQAIRDVVVENDAHVDLLEKDLRTLITAEETRAIAAEKVNHNAITAETEARKTEVSRVETKLDGEISRSKEAEGKLDERLTNEVNRSVERDEKLSTDLDQAKKDLSFIVKNTGTVDLIKVEQEFGSYISAKVNVSGKENNLINKDGEPLYASVDLAYDGDNNKLILSRSGAVDKEIELNEGSIIESIVYDHERKVLIITYYDSKGNEKHEEVNVADLFNQWVVETNHLGAVKLTKDINYDGKGTDKLTAEVVVSKLPTNALINDGGTLYVSNQASDIELGDGTKVTDKITELEKADAELGKELQAEITRATNAETALGTRIDKEVTRATNVENQLRVDLDNEISRSETRDNELTSKLDGEIDRSKEADVQLGKDIDAERNRASAAEIDLSERLSDEVVNRINEVGKVSTKLDNEITRSVDFDNKLREDLDNETNRSTETDANFQLKLENEISRATLAETTLQGNIETEANRAFAKEEKLQIALDDEIIRSKNKDEELSKKLETEIKRSTDADNNYKDSLQAEITRASEAETALGTRIDTEVTRATNVENQLRADLDNEVTNSEMRYNDLNSSIRTEIDRSTVEDSQIRELLTAEANRATAAEIDLSERLSDEVTNRTNDVEKLSTKLDNEITRSVDFDNKLREDLDNETNRSKNYDKESGIKLSKEIHDRISEITRVETKLDGEISRSTEKDNELTNKLTTEENRAKGEEKRIEDKFDNSVSALENADKDLTDKLTQAQKDLSFITKSTGTVNMTKELGETGSVVSATVNVSATKDNLINNNGEALFASVDVTYDSKSNKLILSRSGLDNKEIQLNEGSIIDTITYNEETKELVITYRNSKDETKEVRVGVSELFNDWEVEDNHLGGIILTKTPNFNGKGTDKLSAKVSISELEGNALVNDNGNLYVSNKAKDIILDNGHKLEDELKGLHEADKLLQDNIDAEVDRATKAEQKISDDLIKEINRATTAEQANAKAITDETNRAKEAEAANKTLITTETQERKDEITRVEGLINDEKVRAEGAESDLRTKLSEEVERAKSAESANSQAIGDEVVRATKIEDKLRNDVDKLSGDVSTNKVDIEEKLAAETRRAKEAEEANKKAIADEVVRANAAEKVNSEAIAAEATRAKEVENTIASDLRNEITRATAAEQANKDTIAAEVTRATNKENDLNSLITNEIKRSTDKDDELESRLEQSAKDLSFRVESTPSLELTKTSSETYGHIVKGKVRVSPKEKNIINNDGESLYASVDAEYDTFKNQLTLKTTGNPDKVLQFNNGTIIDSLMFDEKTNKLTISYSDANGGKHVNEANLSYLNNNWKVVNGEGSAVVLTKGEDELTGESTLSAKVVISSEPNSLLKNDNGVLSVTNSADKIVLTDGVTVSQAIETLKAADKKLGEDIVAETNRAKDADRELKTAISDEKARAEGVEKEITANVSNNTKNLGNEINRALAAEKALSDDLKAETKRANEADVALGDRITQEKERAIGKEIELDGKINFENTRAVTKETELGKAIAGVKTKAEANESNITNISKEVERIGRDYSMSVEDTTTVDLTKENLTSGGFKISAETKLSNIEGNTIIKQADGLFSNVNLTYDESNNTLHFSRNGKVVDMVLNTVSTIDSITYDSLTDEIVIKYKGKNGDVLETRFPASALFKPIKANNEGKNVVVEVKQVNGTDVISANVNFVNCIDNQGKNVKLSVTPYNKLAAEAVISTLPNNGLKKDENGSLFVSNRAEDINMCVPDTYGKTVCDAIVKVDTKVNNLEEKFNNYYDEDLINSMNKDIVNLKSKTNMVDVDSASIDLTFTSTEKTSSLRADVIPSNDPHNLVTVYDDGMIHIPDSYGHYPLDTYNGVKFDGNIDYQLFTNEDGSIKSDKKIGNYKFSDWTRHLQEKRNAGLFNTRAEALEFMHRADFLMDKRDGEPLVGRYKNGGENSFILGFVREDENGKKELQTIDNKGTSIDKIEYVPNAKDITATDEFGIQTVTHVPAESLYVEFTDTSCLKHSIIVPFKELIEEYTYPESVSTFDGQLGNSDGESIKKYHNVKFDVERHEDGKSIIKADIDYYDCGEYEGEDFLK